MTNLTIRPLRLDEVSPASIGIPVAESLHVLEIDGKVLCYGDERTLTIIRDHPPTEVRPSSGPSYCGIPLRVCDE